MIRNSVSPFSNFDNLEYTMFKRDPLKTSVMEIIPHAL
jgi:hypothetical protein